ncbi:MAG: hypothetical protein LRZ88_09680 [Candidatus Cloacimonetes bacterium]|nr:hypothetical protein [Candidatus Cloacimonadota bacterium]
MQRLGKKHTEQIPFFRHLWLKKGDYGKSAFGAIMAKLAHKKPDIYIPLIEELMQKAQTSEIAALMDKVMLPLCRKHPEKYLPIVFSWIKRASDDIAKQAVNLCLKLIKRREDLIPEVLGFFQNQWVYPLGDNQALHVNLLKTVAKLDTDAYLSVWKNFGISRDPQIVELLCASIVDYHSELEPAIEIWTKSGNARVKKAGTTALRLIHRKKRGLGMDLSIFITTQGMERLQKRINDLMIERPEVIKAVAIAREFGDLSENAEYKAAKERQRAIDSEIDYLRRRASTLKVVDPSALPKDAVRFGSTCKTIDEHTAEELSFRSWRL